MAYTKNVWKDQDVQRPRTYEVINNQDSTITLTDSFGVVTEIGTPVNAVNMNHIENGIYDNDAHIGDLTELETSTKTDLVSAINEIVENPIDISSKADTDLNNVTNSAKVMMSGMGMPSNTSETLTIGASGTTYTAPANGYYTITGYFDNNNWGNAYVQLRSDTHLGTTGYGTGSQGIYAWVYVPVKKGDVVTLSYYNFHSSAGSMYFVYAEGEV